MKKILVLSGSPKKKGNTMGIVNELKGQIGELDKFDWEVIHIYDHNIHGCIGCKACIIKDDYACPFKDDVIPLLERLQLADGIIFTSPVYSRAVTGQLKNFIDRTNYALHRPKLVGIPTVVITTTDIGMAKSVAKYLSVIASSMGVRVDGILPIKIGAYCNDSNYKDQVDQDLNKIAKIFKASVIEGKQQTPTMGQLLRFNIWKTRAIVTKEKYPSDYNYWDEKKWIDKPFFYPTSINPIKLTMMKLLVKKLKRIIAKGVLY